MEKGFVTLPLEKYHEYLDLKKELNASVKMYRDLKEQIHEVYTVQAGNFITGDPLSHRRKFIVMLDRDKLSELLGRGNVHEDYEVVFQFAPKNNM